LTGGTEVVSALKAKGIKNVDFVIPKEGTLAWVDGIFMSKGAKNPELVQLLIDHMISAKPQAALFESMGFGLANSKAYDLLPADKVVDLQRIDPDKNKDTKYVPWSAVENYDLWTQTWNEVKAGCK
jgi:spermidine/putrescine-binding protein